VSRASRGITKLAAGDCAGLERGRGRIAGLLLRALGSSRRCDAPGLRFSSTWGNRDFPGHTAFDRGLVQLETSRCLLERPEAEVPSRERGKLHQRRTFLGRERVYIGCFALGPVGRHPRFRIPVRGFVATCTGHCLSPSHGLSRHCHQMRAVGPAPSRNGTWGS